ncbi:MAG: respiratory nitrate reductase subunit gamma [Planctomycetota bacterium]|jgi:nitrate reductase gamma subunit
MFDLLLFGVLPYMAMGVFLVVTIQRYRQRTFTYSSLSSQFLENRRHFWGSVPFHYGLLFVLFLHLAGLFVPRWILAWNAVPLRLFITETTGLAMALITVVGLFNIVLRRLTDSKSRTVTSVSDWIVYALLAVQVLSGIGVALFHGWGSSWFATSMTPWLWSLVTLQPELAYVSAMPWLVKLHVVNAWLLIGFFPFTRLVHVLVAPNPYLWRRTQVVIWNWDRHRVRTREENT